MAIVPLSDRGDIKLYILCLMQKVGYPLEYAEINDITLYDGIVSNMDFIEAFDELEKDGLVTANEHGMYTVSDSGAFIAQTLKSEMSGYIHDKGLRAALQYISFGKSNVKKNIRTAENEDGTVTLELGLIKSGAEMMKISLTLDTKYQAQKMALAFSENPERVYARIISLLCGE